MSSYLSVGSDCRLHALPHHAGEPDRQIIVRGMSIDGYPVVSLHMSRADATRLVGELLDAVSALQIGDQVHARDTQPRDRMRLADMEVTP